MLRRLVPKIGRYISAKRNPQRYHDNVYLPGTEALMEQLHQMDKSELPIDEFVFHYTSLLTEYMIDVGLPLVQVSSFYSEPQVFNDPDEVYLF